MRILILTSQLGNGHTRAADAIEAALTRRDPATQIQRVDLWTLMDTRVAEAAKDGYLQVATDCPEIYDQLYHAHSLNQLLGKEPLPESFAEAIDRTRNKWFAHSKGWRSPRSASTDETLLVTLLDMLSGRSTPVPDMLFRHGVLMWIRALLLRRLKAQVARFAPDVIIATQVCLSALMNVLKRRGDFEKLPMLNVMTDYGIHQFWVQFGTKGSYCVATEAMARELRAGGVPAERVHVTGIPLMPQFNELPSQAQARRHLGLDPRRPVVLVTGGWFGIGVADAVKGLVERGVDIQTLVTTGRADKDAVTMLGELAQRVPQSLRLIEWSEEMPVLLRAADVVVGKPGGLSVAEALACGRPFIATHSLGGQEGFNSRFLEVHGIGRQVPPEQLFDALYALLSNPRALARSQDLAAELGWRYGADQIGALAAAHTRAAGQSAPRWAI